MKERAEEREVKNKYLYYCLRCGFLGSAEHDNPNEYQECSECKNAMTFTGLTKDEWASKTKEEKDILKSEFKEKLEDKSNSSNDALLNVMRKISNDVGTIKTIVLTYVIVSIICGIIILSNIF